MTTPKYLRGLGIPYATTGVKEYATTPATQDGAHSGVPTPMTTGVELKLGTSGRQSAASALTIQTQNAGTPGPGGASFLWKDGDDPNDDYRGRDIQQASAWQDIYNNGVIPNASIDFVDTVDCCVTQTGSIIVTAHVKTTDVNNFHQVWVWRWTEESAAITTTIIYYTSEALSSRRLNPTVSVADNGDVYLCHWTYDIDNQLGNVASYRSTAASDGASFSIVNHSALREQLDISMISGAGNLGFSVKRLRLAVTNGQALLVGWCTRNDSDTRTGFRDSVIQFASNSLCGQFDLVIMTPILFPNVGNLFDTFDCGTFSHHSVFAHLGKFYTIWPSRNRICL